MYSEDTISSHPIQGLLWAPANAVEDLTSSSGKHSDRSRLFPFNDSGVNTPNCTLDNEQKISQEFFSGGHADFIHEIAFSAPTYDRVPTPPTWSDLPDDVLSPAAMFLSAFSPPTPAITAFPDSEGEVVAGWTLGSVIGYGGFSTIRRACSSSGGTAAVKIIRRSDISKQSNPTTARKRLSHEEEVWSTISHEHILPLFSVTHTAYADFFFTLYCPAGSLFDILKRDGTPALPHDDAGMMFRQVVRGLRYLHEGAGLVHRDMKLENVLVDEMGVCKIGDFGMAKRIGELDDEVDEDQLQEQTRPGERPWQTLSHSRRQTRPGLPVHLSLIRHQSGPRHRNSTPLSLSPDHDSHKNLFQPGSLPYASPELLLPAPCRPHPAQDMWAIGVMLYIMLTGNFPFNDSFEPRLQMKILHGAYELPPDIGRGATRVIRGCLERSLPSRWTIAKVDEVAWGVGWGTDNDDASSSSLEDDEEFEIIEHPDIQSGTDRLATRHALDTLDSYDEDWKHDLTRPSLEASRRRSSFRSARSLSRAPALASRSRSRPRHPQPKPPCLTSLANAILNAPSAQSPTSSSSTPSIHDDSALLLTPLTFERGRRPQKSRALPVSRSPSPSIVPATPIDFENEGPHFPQPRDGNARSTSRGRTAFGRGVRTPRPEHLSMTYTDLNVLEETERWRPEEKDVLAFTEQRRSRLDSLRDNDEGSLDRSLMLHHDTSKGDIGRRAGSTPPAPLSSQATRVRKEDDGILSLRFSDYNSRGSSKSIPVPSSSVRSRSVDYGRQR